MQFDIMEKIMERLPSIYSSTNEETEPVFESLDSSNLLFGHLKQNILTYENYLYITEDRIDTNINEPINIIKEDWDKCIDSVSNLLGTINNFFTNPDNSIIPTKGVQLSMVEEYLTTSEDVINICKYELEPEKTISDIIMNISPDLMPYMKNITMLGDNFDPIGVSASYKLDYDNVKRDLYLKLYGEDNPRNIQVPTKNSNITITTIQYILISRDEWISSYKKFASIVDKLKSMYIINQKNKDNRLEITNNLVFLKKVMNIIDAYRRLCILKWLTYSKLRSDCKLILNKLLGV